MECRPSGASGLMTPWWLPQPEPGTRHPGFVMCLDLLTSVLMKKVGGVWRRLPGAAEGVARPPRLLRMAPAARLMSPGAWECAPDQGLEQRDCSEQAAGRGPQAACGADGATGRWPRPSAPRSFEGWRDTGCQSKQGLRPHVVGLPGDVLRRRVHGVGQQDRCSLWHAGWSVGLRTGTVGQVGLPQGVPMEGAHVVRQMGKQVVAKLPIDVGDRIIQGLDDRVMASSACGL